MATLLSINDIVLKSTLEKVCMDANRGTASNIFSALAIV